MTDNDYGGYEEAYYRAGVRHGISREFGPCPSRSDNLWHVYVYNCGKITGKTRRSTYRLRLYDSDFNALIDLLIISEYSLIVL